MANTLVQFRLDDMQRVQATNICERLGIDLPTAMWMFIARIIQENGIPFSMKLDDDKGAEAALSAMRRASQIATEQGIADMTLDEINAEIAAARQSGAQR